MLPRHQSPILGTICSCLSQPDLATSQITAWRHLIQLYRRTLIWVAFETVGSSCPTVWAPRKNNSTFLITAMPNYTWSDTQKERPPGPESMRDTVAWGALRRFAARNSHGRHYKNLQPSQMPHLAGQVWQFPSCLLPRLFSFATPTSSSLATYHFDIWYWCLHKGPHLRFMQ